MAWNYEAGDSVEEEGMNSTPASINIHEFVQVQDQQAEHSQRRFARSMIVRLQLLDQVDAAIDFRGGRRTASGEIQSEADLCRGVGAGLLVQPSCQRRGLFVQKIAVEHLQCLCRLSGGEANRRRAVGLRQIELHIQQRQ